MVIVVALLIAPCTHPMERILKAFSFFKEARRTSQEASKDLLQAANYGNLQRVQSSLNAGADVNIQDEAYWTPLHWAAKMGHKEIVEILLRAGADKDRVEYYGYTPLHLASITEVVEALVYAGADKDRQGNDGNTPLHLAAIRGHKEVVEVLIRAGLL